MDRTSSILTSMTILGVVGLIVFGINSCGERVTALKQACIQSGGQVINSGDSFHCLRSVVPPTEVR